MQERFQSLLSLGLYCYFGTLNDDSSLHWALTITSVRSLRLLGEDDTLTCPVLNLNHPSLLFFPNEPKSEVGSKGGKQQATLSILVCTEESNSAGSNEYLPSRLYKT